MVAIVRLGMLMPAELTRMSSGPRASSAHSKQLSHAGAIGHVDRMPEDRRLPVPGRGGLAQFVLTPPGNRHATTFPGQRPRCPIQYRSLPR